jgi:uncharacterized SAM-binding protein YcdF (DUF218 family)
MQQTLKRRYWLQLVLILVLLVVAWGICLSVDIYTYSFVADPSPADAAIVLGAAAWNTEPSPVFEERIKHAISLYHERRIKVIIFTGGAGKDEPVAESVVASQYAIQNGVAVQDIYCETISRLTYENLCGARTIIQREHIRRVLIVSDPLHMRRAITIARDLGIDAYPSPTPTSRYISLSSRLDFLWGEVRPYTTYLLRRPFKSIVPEGTEAYPCK